MPNIPMPYTVHLDHTLRVTLLNTLFAKGDSAAHRFELTILRAGVQEDLTGCNVVCKFYRMAESAVVSVDGTIEDGKAVAVLNKDCYDYIGRFALTIAIKKGEEETTVFYGDGYMHGQRADTSISGEYIIYDINTLLEKIAEIDAATQAANTATSNANTATANANTATGNANAATENANAGANNANKAAAKINGMTIAASGLSAGASPTAELSEIDGHYHIALGLPKGDTGATPQISVQVATGAAGSEASVSVSGTAENPVILLTIPRGDVGNIGNLTINGKTPDGSGAVTLTAEDVGALATGGTAADSSKLGGKAPEYYMQPRNLLDNSDFTNPVNQRGITSADVSAWTYFIDRWKVEDDTLTISVETDGIHLTASSRAWFSQWIQMSDNDVGKTFTLAYGLSDSSIIMASGTMPDASECSEFITGTNDAAQIRSACFENRKITVGINPKSNLVIKWAALYEGSYTADTLPPYVPKGYPAELTECQRYYYTIKSDDSSYAAYATGTMNTERSAYFPIVFPIPMRIAPTLSYSGNFRVYVNGAGRSITDMENNDQSRYSSRIIINNISSGVSGQACELQSSGDGTAFIAFSADL